MAPRTMAPRILYTCLALLAILYTYYGPTYSIVYTHLALLAILYTYYGSTHSIVYTCLALLAVLRAGRLAC